MADSIVAKNIEAAVELDNKSYVEPSLANRLADSVARFTGSILFILSHILIFGLWIGFNCIKGWAFDPYPFTFLTMAVSLESIFLSSFVMISQNRLSELSERRHKLDLQINLLAEQENTITLRVLEKIATKLGVDQDCLAEIKDYLDDIDPVKVLDEVVKQEEKAAK